MTIQLVLNLLSLPECLEKRQLEYGLQQDMLKLTSLIRELQQGFKAIHYGPLVGYEILHEHVATNF